MNATAMTTSQAVYRQRRRGLALVYTALVLLVLVGLIGLAADTAYVFLTGQRLQIAADAAALAGALEVEYSTANAITNAVNTAAANKAAGAAVQLNSSTDVQVGNYVRSTATFTANTAPYNACKVTAKRTTGSLGGALKLIFGAGFGTRTSNVSRYAIAMNDGTPNGVIVLSPNASPAVQLTGTGTSSYKLIINNCGNVIVNSTSSTCIQWTGHPCISANAFCMCGNDTAVNTGGVFPSGTAQLNCSPCSDPLGSCAAPSQPGLSSTWNGTTHGNLQPGYYPYGLPAGTCNAGLYWVDGGCNLNWYSNLDTSSGCCIYLHTGGFNMDSTCSLNLCPQTTGGCAGICIYQDRGNNSSCSYAGTNITCTGQCYHPAAQCTCSCTSSSCGSRLICNTLKLSGCSQINYDHNLDIPTHTVFLVQ